MEWSHTGAGRRLANSPGALERGTVTRMRSLKPFLLSLFVVLVLLLVACQTLSPTTAVPDSASDEQTAAGSLTDLDTIDQLQSQFNSDEGKPRLLMILAPT